MNASTEHGDGEVHSSQLARLAFFFLVLCSLLAPTINVLINAITNGQADNLSGESSPIRIALYIVIFSSTIYSVFSARGSTSWWPLPAAFSIAIAWFAVTLFASANPSVGLRRLILTVAIAWSVFALIEQIGYEAALTPLRKILVAAMIANYFAVILFPSFGITDDVGVVNASGSWRGILTDKNYAGPICAFTVLLFTFDANRISRLLRLAIVILATYFLYRSNSRTSLGLTVICIAVGFSSKRYDPYYRLTWLPVAGVVVSLALGFYFAYLPELSASAERFFEDPESLTGRVQIWPFLWDFAQKNLIFGAGFGSFWNIGNSSPIFGETEGWISEIASGHNGYLDLLVQVGIPGLLLAILATMAIPAVHFAVNGGISRDRRALLLSCFLYVIGHNFTETSLFDRDSITFVILLVTVALLRLEANTRSQSPAHLQPRAESPSLPAD